MGNKSKVKWEKEATDHDYQAAATYLRLLFNDRATRQIVRRLRKAPTIEFEAKDILRASQTHLLDKEDAKVHQTLKDIKNGKTISPVLLVRGHGGRGVTLTIADGYHRICAVWHWDDKAPIACCLVECPGRDG